MSDIRTAMPVLARHEGAWEGVYIHMDTDGREIDRHKAALQCRFPADGPFAYHQVNTYTWDDGRVEESHFPATFRDGRIWWDTERIEGSAWEIDARTVVLTWTRSSASAPPVGPSGSRSRCLPRGTPRWSNG